MSNREAAKLLREAMRQEDPRRAIAMVRRVERATGQRFPEVREAIGRGAATLHKLYYQAS